MCPPQVYPCLFIDSSAFHSSEIQNFPAKVTCLATSIILAVGRRREYSTKQMEGNDSIQPAWPRNMGCLPGPSHPREIRVFKLLSLSPSTGLSLYISASAVIGPTPIPRSECSASLTPSWFFLNSHNSFQKQVFAKPSCSDPWPSLSILFTPCWTKKSRGNLCRKQKVCSNK